MSTPRPGAPEPAGRPALALADRRAAGEPLQYVLGTWPFRTLELEVDRRVLIPRPETEQVVDAALGELSRIAADREPAGQPTVCVDLGTGSGAIALSLAAEGTTGGAVEIWATDASTDALEVARANRARLARRDPTAAARVTLAGGVWFEALPAALAGAVDLVVSNPPYVSEKEYPGLGPEVRDHEPRDALVAGPGANGRSGMADIEAVVAGAASWLRPSGGLVVELAPSQATAAVEAALRAGFSRARAASDLAGRLRMLVAER